MNERARKGLILAATMKIKQGKDGWIVPSQTGNGDTYTVNVDEQRCTCPDHQVRRMKCKHLFAVEYTIQREVVSDGETTITKTTETVKVTYTQDWTAYNAAQVEEKGRFAELLADLCGTIRQPEQPMGRPRLPLADMVFAMVSKVYAGFSSRRFSTDLRWAQEDGFIGKAAHFNSVSRYLANPDLTPIFVHLVTASSLPLSKVETNFAVDSTGFSTSRFVRWYNKKYGKEVDNREWVKAHLMNGVKTHIVSSVEISGWEAHDTNFFEPLLTRTAQHFQVDEVSADKAYLSHHNMEIAMLAGAIPFIPFKSNTVEPADDSVWARMYHYFMYNREDFMAHYHQRSNAESTISMMKAKFGDSVRSKSDVGQINEVLCKVLAHNICVLIQAMYELGIEPTFGAEKALAPKVAA